MRWAPEKSIVKDDLLTYDLDDRVYHLRVTSVEQEYRRTVYKMIIYTNETRTDVLTYMNYNQNELFNYLRTGSMKLVEYIPNWKKLLGGN